MHTNPIAPFPSRRNVGLRRQLVVAFGLLSLLMAVVAGIALWGIASVRASARQAVAVDGQLSRLAGDVALQTLQSRRYEKDFFLNISDSAARTDYLAKWRSAHAALDQAIASFAAAATTADDQQQVARWHDQEARYDAAFEQIMRAVARGDITTSQAANVAITPFKEPIRVLTESSVEVAAHKAAVASADESTLEAIGSRTTWLVAMLAGVSIIIGVGWSLLFAMHLLRPVIALQTATRRVAGGDLAARVDLVRDDEFGILARSFNQMAATIGQQLADQQRANVDLQRLVNEVRARAAEQDRLLAENTQQRDAIRELSVPVLPVQRGTLAMPLIGALDSTRLLDLQERALQAIQRASARCLLLDITGVPLVDTQVAKGLIGVVQAARLLGTEVVLVGIRPEVAQTIVGLGLDLREVRTYSDIQTALDSSERPANRRAAALR